MKALTTATVQEALAAHQLDIQVQVFETSTRTAAEAAASIGTPLGSIVKSLVFEINSKIIVVLTAGDQRVDTRKLADYFGVGRKKVKIATAEQCIEHVGYAPGGVPPLGHRHQLDIYIDNTLSRFATVYAAAGTNNTIFPIAYDTLVEVTAGVVLDVVKAGP